LKRVSDYKNFGAGITKFRAMDEKIWLADVLGLECNFGRL
jgi:hypothetical protein